MRKGTRVTNTGTDAVEYPGLERWRGQVDEKLGNIEQTMIRLERSIETMTNTVMAAIRETSAAHAEREKDFEQRIKSLETAHSWVRAKVAIFAGFAGLIGGGLSSAAWGALFHRVLGY
jgi:phage-related minor tail protein